MQHFCDGQFIFANRALHVHVTKSLGFHKNSLEKSLEAGHLLKPQWSNSEHSMGFDKDPITEKKRLVFTVAMRPWYILVLLVS
jgi:hypothetical protein